MPHPTTEEIAVFVGPERAVEVEEARWLYPGVLLITEHTPDLEAQIEALRVLQAQGTAAEGG